MERKIKRGANFVLSQELFDDMLSKYIGLETGSISVWSITNQHYARAVEISVITDDERFPEIPEGSRFPTLTPIVEDVKVSDNPLRFETQLKGFIEVNA